MMPAFQSTEAALVVLGGGSQLSRTARELNTALERALAPFDVTAQQAALLLRLRTETSPTRLAASLGTDTAGMTRLLDRLEDKGLSRRAGNPSDRRSVSIELTSAGAALAPRLAPVFGQVIRRLFDGFTDDEIRQLSAMLGRMHANLTVASPGDEGQADPVDAGGRWGTPGSPEPCPHPDRRGHSYHPAPGPPPGHSIY